MADQPPAKKPYPYQATLNCRSCRTDFTCSPRWAKTTLYCPLCQVVRDAPYYRATPRTCANAGCGNKFYPIRTAKGWARCGYCDIFALDKCVLCATCGTASRPAFGLNTSCLGCVQSSPERRDQYVERVRGIVAERQAEALAAAA